MVALLRVGRAEHPDDGPCSAVLSGLKFGGSRDVGGEVPGDWALYEWVTGYGQRVFMGWRGVFICCSSEP